MNEDKKVKYGPFETIYEGGIFKIKHRKIFYPDGSEQTHEYCQRFDSVTALVFDEKDRILLTREFRESRNRYVWFLPSGKIDKNEKPEQAMQRELREEIGKRANTLKLLFERKSSSSYFIWDTYVFVARDLVDDALEAEEYYPIEIVPTPMDKAVEMALSGEIENVFLAYNIIRFNYMLKNGKFKW